MNAAALSRVRDSIDAVDRELVRLLAERKSLVERAAEIKMHPRNIVDPARNEAVLDNVLAAAREFGLPAALAERVWRLLTELWIRHQIDFMLGRPGAADPGDARNTNRETPAPPAPPISHSSRH